MTPPTAATTFCVATSPPGRARAAARNGPLGSSMSSQLEGEHFETSERLVVAPDAGVFQPAPELGFGSTVAAGQVIGHLTSGTRRTPVVSPFSGQTCATLAWAGERLVAHQPVMWLSIRSATT